MTTCPSLNVCFDAGRGKFSASGHGDIALVQTVKDATMLKTAFRFLALTTAIAGLGTTIVMGAANAATPTGDVPLCSKTITDKCMNRSAPAHPVKHAAAHHAHKAAIHKA